VGVIGIPRREDERLSESLNERSAGIWVALVTYVISGVYMLGFWAVLSQSAYYLLVLGIISLLIAVALFRTSRWAWWLGLFSFPIFFVDVVYALLASVSFTGWNPDLTTGLFQASMIIYLVLMGLGFLLLVDRRNVLRSDRILDLLNKPFSSKSTLTDE
jgi:hypothetical protein